MTRTEALLSLNITKLGAVNRTGLAWMAGIGTGLVTVVHVLFVIADQLPAAPREFLARHDVAAGAVAIERVATLLVRDYERRTEHHEAMVYWATVLLMTRRLVRRRTDPPIIQRWGQPRTVASGPEPASA